MGFGGKDSDTKPAGDFKDTCDGLVIETNKDGTLKSANIAEANWTPRQREFVEKCLKAAAMSGKGDNENNGQGAKDMPPATNGVRRSLKEELKVSFKQIAGGNAEAVEMMKEPFRMAKDLYKAGKLIGQGNFRELRDRAALRIHDNIEAMGLLSDNMQKRINEANKRIEERLGIENREKNPSVIAKMQGRSINALKNVFKRLSGRTGVQSVKSVKGKDTGKGLSR